MADIDISTNLRFAFIFLKAIYPDAHVRAKQ